MAGKPVNSSAGGCLVVLLPIAFGIAFLFVAWPVLLALLLLGIILRLWQNYQWQKWSQQVNPFFHQLIQETQGRVTALDLAMKANLPASAAQRYLETKSQEFGARALDYQDQGTVYYFVTASTLGTIFDDSEEYSLDDDSDDEDSEDETTSLDEQPSTRLQDKQPTEKQTSSKGIIQSELARRLDVHSSTVYKRRSEPYFSDWSKSRDPEGIAWKYSSKSRLFFPIES